MMASQKVAIYCVIVLFTDARNTKCMSSHLKKHNYLYMRIFA
jgi:hypothetical protein